MTAGSVGTCSCTASSEPGALQLRLRLRQVRRRDTRQLLASLLQPTFRQLGLPGIAAAQQWGEALLDDPPTHR